MAENSLASPKRVVSIRNFHPRLRVPLAAVRTAIGILDANAGRFLGGCPPGELSIVFLTDSALARIHGDFMADPTPTDVITFEGDGRMPPGGPAEEVVSAGEICVSADTAARYVGLAPTAGRRPVAKRHAAFVEELTLYLVHGWLHLAGYDDRKPAWKRRMRAAERRALELLRKNKAVPAFRLT